MAMLAHTSATTVTTNYCSVITVTVVTAAAAADACSSRQCKQTTRLSLSQLYFCPVWVWLSTYKRVVELVQCKKHTRLDRLDFLLLTTTFKRQDLERWNFLAAAHLEANFYQWFKRYCQHDKSPITVCIRYLEYDRCEFRVCSRLLPTTSNPIHRYLDAHAQCGKKCLVLASTAACTAVERISSLLMQAVGTPTVMRITLSN